MPFPYPITFLTHDDYDSCTGHIAPMPGSATSVVGTASTYGEAFDLLGRDGEYPDSVCVVYEFVGDDHAVTVKWVR